MASQSWTAKSNSQLFLELTSTLDFLGPPKCDAPISAGSNLKDSTALISVPHSNSSPFYNKQKGRSVSIQAVTWQDALASTQAVL